MTHSAPAIVAMYELLTRSLQAEVLLRYVGDVTWKRLLRRTIVGSCHNVLLADARSSR